MSTELAEAAQNLLEEFNSSWSYDSRDLLKPSLEAAMKKLIEQRPQDIRPRLSDEFFGYGPITGLLADASVSEIIVNGAEEIWYEHEGHFCLLEDAFLTTATFKGFIERLCVEAEVHVDLAQPFADGRWRGFRLHLVHEPLSHCRFHLSLRRQARNPWTLDSLQARGWARPEQIKILRELIRSRQNLLFIGPTGSGKTSLLGACMLELPANERVLVIEDTDELPRPNSASTKLLTRVATPHWQEVQLTDLIRQSLRMRPSRLVVGEVRGGEAKDLLMALATGHTGGMSSLHASDARQALLRLEMLVQLGAPQWQTQAVRQLLLLSVNHLIVCGLKDGQRRLEGIFRVAALESVGLLLEPV